MDRHTRQNRTAWEATSRKHVREYQALLDEARSASALFPCERELRPSGHLFVYEAHPSVPLWSWDADKPRIRPDRSYFARGHVNDTFPARGAVECQTTLGEVVNALISAGLEIRHLAEHPEPFWQPAGISAAAWQGRLPNTYSLIARRPGGDTGRRP
jgi:hypothetical protein